MADPVTLLIAGAIGAAAAYAIVFFVDLTLQILVKWFRQFSYLVLGGDSIAFTLQEHLSNGQYKTVQGIFNTNSNSLVQVRGIRSDNVDAEVRAAHEYGREKVVIWQ